MRKRTYSQSKHLDTPDIHWSQHNSLNVGPNALKHGRPKLALPAPLQNQRSSQHELEDDCLVIADRVGAGERNLHQARPMRRLHEGVQ